MKSKKKRDSSSSSSSGSSSSKSRSRSRSPKKSKEKRKERKHSSSSNDSSPKRHTTKRPELVEHSKWDSPVEKNSRNDNKRRNDDRMNRDRRDNRNDRQWDNSRDNRQRGNSRDRNRDRNRGRNDDYDSRRNDRGNSPQRRNDDRRDNFRNRGRRDRSRSRSDSRERSRGGNRNDNRDRKRHRSRSKSFDHSNAKWGRNDDSGKGDKQKPTEKEKPNFGLSGKLTEETNTYKGVVIKYSEPPEARKPKRRWRLYPFKGEKAMQTLYIHRQSAYLIGRDRKIADLPVDHPSCSKQHAVLQYRLVNFTREDGSSGKRIRPYIIDLNSANGTFLNNKKIDPQKYVELLEKDVIKFGFSSREYVMLHENSKDEAQDDDVKLSDDETVVKKEEPAD